jgi:dTMP kinase
MFNSTYSASLCLFWVLAVMTKRGAFILLEGCDRTGKSTQCQLLVDWLNTNQSSAAPIAELCKFPGNRT